MARKPRVEFAGALYHVIARGNQRRDIFADDEDRRGYLQRLEHYRVRYQFTVYAYMLMSNHVHLLLETGSVPLSKIMQGIQFSFTQRYNRRHGTTGHVFQSRYKAILCDRDAYLLELVRYIHLNPARMKRPLSPWNYRWSSHRAYAGVFSPVKVDTATVLSQFTSSHAVAYRAYLKFMHDGLTVGHNPRFYDAIDQRFLGGERFLEQVEKKAEERAPNTTLKVSLRRVIDAVAAMHEVEPERLVSRQQSRDWVKPRSLLVYVAREWCGITAKKIGEELQRDGSTISKLHTRYAATRDKIVETRLLSILQEQ
jgi:putative transposase